MGFIPIEEFIKKEIEEIINNGKRHPTHVFEKIRPGPQGIYEVYMYEWYVDSSNIKRIDGKIAQILIKGKPVDNMFPYRKRHSGVSYWFGPYGCEIVLLLIEIRWGGRIINREAFWVIDSEYIKDDVDAIKNTILSTAKQYGFGDNKNELHSEKTDISKEQPDGRGD